MWSDVRRRPSAWIRRLCKAWRSSWFPSTHHRSSPRSASRASVLRKNLRPDSVRGQNPLPYLQDKVRVYLNGMVDHLEHGTRVAVKIADNEDAHQHMVSH
jgi:hypothetical protein